MSAQLAPSGDGSLPAAIPLCPVQDVVPFPDTTRTLYVFESRDRATPASDVARRPRSAGQLSRHGIAARPVASVAE